MKRWVFIVGGIIILALVLVWLFVLFASDETKQDVFNRFGLDGVLEDGGAAEEFFDSFLPDPDAGIPQQLRQLTTRRVLTHQEIIASSTPYVIFVEAGTGHVYKVTVASGAEERLLGITTALAKKASLSLDTRFVAIQATDQRYAPVTITTIVGDQATADSHTLSDPIDEFAFNANGMLYYTVRSGAGLLGKAYDPETKEEVTLFSLPFYEANVLWGSDGDSPLVFPKTTRLLEGFVYELKDAAINRLPITGYGLGLIKQGDMSLLTSLNNSQYTSWLYNLKTGNKQQLSALYLPEKCTFDAFGSTLLCARSNFNSVEFPDDWYRGEVSYQDELWAIDVATNEPTLLVDTLPASGREIDAMSLAAPRGTAALYFINKNDWTLWVYESVPSVNPSL